MTLDKPSGVNSAPTMVTTTKQNLQSNTLLAGCLANRFKVTLLSLQVTTTVLAAVAAVIAGIFASYILLAIAAGACLVSIASTILTSRIKTSQNETNKKDKAQEALEVKVQVKDVKQEQELQKRIDELSKNVEDLKNENEGLKKSSTQNKETSEKQEEEYSEIIEKLEEKIVKLEQENKLKQPKPVASPASSPARAALKRRESLIANATKLNEENERLKKELESQDNSKRASLDSPKTSRVVNELSQTVAKLNEENERLKKQLESHDNSSEVSPELSEALKSMKELSREIAAVQQENEELKSKLVEKQENSSSTQADNLPPPPPAGGPPPPPPPINKLKESKPLKIVIPNRKGEAGATDKAKDKPKIAGGGLDMGAMMNGAKAREEKSKAQKLIIEGHKKTIELQLNAIKKFVEKTFKEVQEFNGNSADFRQLLKKLQKEIDKTDVAKKDKDACIKLLQTIIDSK